MKTLIKAGLAAATAGLAAGPAAAEWPNDEPITFIIPYSAGGGFDAIVRAFAPALEEQLGEGVEVVPENIPGAGGQVGGRTVMRADPDGYTIGIFNIPGLTVSQVLGEDIGFDLDDVTWIANLATSRYAVAVQSDSEIQSVEDLCSLGRPAKLSDTGPASTSSIAAQISFHLLDCPITNVTGYSGSNDTMIGVMRGEVDATLKPIGSLQRYVDSGDLRYILTLTEEEVVEGVPTAADIGRPELAQFDVRRIVGGPPGMPEDIVERLSEAFIAAANSEEVQEWSERTGADVDPRGAEETTATMDELSTFYEQYRDVLSN